MPRMRPSGGIFSRYFEDLLFLAIFFFFFVVCCSLLFFTQIMVFLQLSLVKIWCCMTCLCGSPFGIVSSHWNERLHKRVLWCSTSSERFPPQTGPITFHLTSPIQAELEWEVDVVTKLGKGPTSEHTLKNMWGGFAGQTGNRTGQRCTWMSTGCWGLTGLVDRLPKRKKTCASRLRPDSSHYCPMACSVLPNPSHRGQVFYKTPIGRKPSMYTLGPFVTC